MTNYIEIELDIINLKVFRGQWEQVHKDVCSQMVFDTFISNMHKFYASAPVNNRQQLEANAQTFEQHYSQSVNKQAFLIEHFQQCYCDTNSLWLRAYAALVSELVPDEEIYQAFVHTTVLANLLMCIHDAVPYNEYVH